MIIKITALGFWQRFSNLSALHGGALSCFAAQMTGSRESQQDSLKIIEQVEFTEGHKGALLIVADGMGGHKGGELASQMVVDAFTKAFKKSSRNITQRFETALEQSNRQIEAFIDANPEYENMGSTVLAVLVVGGRLYWLSVGDSPLWLVRRGKITRLNQDHSMLPVLNKMAQMGELAVEDISQDPNRHVLRSVVNGKPIKLVDSKTEPMLLEPCDLILLASDGLQTLEEHTIAELLAQSRGATCQAIVERLLNQVERRQTKDQDNTSVIVARLSRTKSVYIKLAAVVGLLSGIAWLLLGWGG